MYDKDPIEEFEQAEQLEKGCFRACMIFIFACIVTAICMLFSGCTTTKYVPIIEYHTDTLVQTKVQHDSIYINDSTVITEKGDTVKIEKWHTKYVDRMVHDTTYIAKNDTVPQPYPVTEYIEKELTWWQQLRIHLGGIMIFLAVILAFIKWGIPLIKRLK